MAVAPVKVVYRFRLGDEGTREEVACDRAAIDRALDRPGSGGWGWELDALTFEQARELGVYRAAGGVHVLDLPRRGPVFVRVGGPS